MKKPRFAFGPGTALALVASAVVLAYSARSSPPTEPPKLPKLPPVSGTPPPVPNKPEPLRLLSLGLDPPRAAKIRAIDAAWQRERKELISAMEDAADPARQAGRSLNQLRAGLQGYSALSREYDRTRRRHWEAALAELSPEQRKKVDIP